MRCVKPLFLASTILTASLTAAKADVNVVASIKPVHSLVAAVMQGVGEPSLIVEGAGSPHNYSLKPSQAETLEKADVVFWIGRDLEAFLEKPLETIAANAKTVALIDAHDLTKLKFREGGAFDAHGHEEEGHDNHDDHGHDDHGHKEHKKDKDHDDHGHDDHGHEKKAEAGHDDHGHDDHGHKKEKTGHEGHDHAEHGEFDPHIWLDPINAKALVHEIEEVLSKADPKNAEKYEANAEAVEAKMDALVSELSAELKSVHGKGFIVFHDAYQYFEKRFDITAAGSITISPEISPGVERISEIKKKVQELGATCVFAEPQFEPKLVATVIEGTQAKSGIIDPLGVAIDAGVDHYPKLIRTMAGSLKTCLSGSN